MPKPMTILAQLLAKCKDGMGYETLVFKCLDDEVIKHTKYLMCVKYPNWNHRELKLGEVGYLNFVEVQAGIDSWFDGKDMIPYRYSNIQFIRFIERPMKDDYTYIM